MNKTLLALLAMLSLAQFHPLLAAPEWVAHASAAGPDLAPVGVSRFDQLFQKSDGQYSIPYPFDDLLALLESKVDNGEHSGLRQVFIPLGRSLQRDAPAPDFFRFPRMVAALQGEPLAGADGVLEYRLFIAHQPSTETLEIISYNDSAGRFEFQVVEDYGAGQRPRVRQANRRMCLSCHQNAAPIFAMRPWSETTFNVEVAGHLAQAMPHRFSSLIATLSADAGALDLLAERANYLAAAQLIWQRGCSREACRAAVLRAVLQYRLSGKSSFERDHPVYRDHYRADLRRNWQRYWPDGLLLGNSRIPDRDPFDAVMTRAQDPLSLRAPHARWRQADAILADGIIQRLAGFLTQADIVRIDRHLLRAARESALPARHYESRCRLASVAAATRLLECSGDNASAGLAAVIELEYDAGEIRSLHLLSLRIAGGPQILQPEIGEISLHADGLRAQLANQGGISMRLASGDRLATVELQWQDAQLRGDIRLRVTRLDDFGLIDEALETLLRERHKAGADSLGAKPFRRDSIIDALEQALGMAASAKRQAGATPANRTIGADSSKSSTATRLQGDLELLRPYCAACHGSDTRRPPGFLAGADARDRVAHCAPRILARLQAWQVSEEDAVVSMPPPATIHANWVRSDHYRKLLDALGALADQTAAPPVSASVTDYQRLPACLAPG